MKSTVLIIDDDEMIREVFARALSNHGYAAAQAADGERGVAAARTMSPSLIILDLDMPGISGWETMKLLQADAATASIPVVLATSCHVTPERVQMAGFRGYLQKPVTLAALITHVRDCTGPSAEVGGPLRVDPPAPLLPPC